MCVCVCVCVCVHHGLTGTRAAARRVLRELSSLQSTARLAFFVLGALAVADVTLFYLRLVIYMYI